MPKIRVRAQPALRGDRRASAHEETRRRLARAHEHGWKATEGPHGAFFVPSVHEPRIARVVHFITGMDGVLWGTCTCPAGFWRGERAADPTPVPCWHVAATLELLHTQNRVAVVNGLMVWKIAQQQASA